MNQIRKPIKIAMYYLPNGVRASGLTKVGEQKDMSVRQLSQYLEKCIEEANNEE